jgi:uncharacterized protein (TIGR01777 family)
MRIFITGATGFVGQALVPALLADGHAVAAWVRDPARAHLALGARVQTVAATPDAERLEAAVREADAVINLQGEPIVGARWTGARKVALMDSRVGITTRLAAALSRSADRPRLMLSASAVGYYGDRGDELLDEASPAGHGFLSEICLHWERATEPARAAGARTALLRIGVVLGRGGGALAKMLPPFRLGMGGRLGAGTQWMPWVHQADVVQLVRRALTDPRYEGPINVVAPAAVTNREFTEALGHALHRPAVMAVPAAALRLALGEAAVTVLGSQRVVPRALERLGYSFVHPALGAALTDVLATDAP